MIKQGTKLLMIWGKLQRAYHFAPAYTLESNKLIETLELSLWETQVLQIFYPYLGTFFRD